jgi:ABC-2 type transport system ATP-binding protein
MTQSRFPAVGVAPVVMNAVVGRAPPLALAPLTMTLDNGVHALLGAREDGVALVLALLAGRARARAGLLRVLGSPPEDPRTARVIAYVPLDATLPDALRVHEALELAMHIRGVSMEPAEKRLDALGIGPLAARKVRSLAPDEVRAVAIAEALTSGARLVAIEEPLVRVDPRAVARIPDRMRERAEKGACVVFATSSSRDASELAEDVFCFQRGALIRRIPAREALAIPAPSPAGAGASLHVLSSDPRALVAELAREPAAETLETRGRAVVARGPDLPALAAAVGRAIARAEVDVESMRTDAPPLDFLQRTAPTAPVSGA